MHAIERTDRDACIVSLKYNFVGTLLGLYLGFSPVYWFFSLPVSYVSYFKVSLLTLGIFSVLTIALKERALFLPTGLFGVGGFLLLILSMAPGFFQSEGPEVLRRFLDILYGFSFSWTFYLYIRCHGNIYRTFWISSALIVFFSCLVIVAKFIPLLNWRSPFVAGFYFTDTGFGGLRTGWSVGVSFFIPFSLMISFLIEKKHILYFIICLFFFNFSILASQIVVGGRSGIVSSLIIIIVWFLKEKKFSFFWITFVFLLFFSIFDMQWLSSHLRIDRLNSIEGMGGLNSFSANRIMVNFEAMRMISERVVVGYGFGGIDGVFLRHGDLVHNLWLRIMLQTGLVGFCALCFIFFNYFMIGIKLYRESIKIGSLRLRYLTFSLALVIFCGLILSMFEPNVILGTFQTSATWWASVGTIKGLHDSLNTRSTYA